MRPALGVARGLGGTPWWAGPGQVGWTGRQARREAGRGRQAGRQASRQAQQDGGKFSGAGHL